MNTASIVVLAFAGIFIISGIIFVQYANKANEKMQEEENKKEIEKKISNNR